MYTYTREMLCICQEAYMIVTMGSPATPQVYTSTGRAWCPIFHKTPMLTRRRVELKVWEHKPFPAPWNVPVIPSCRLYCDSATRTCRPAARAPAACTSRKRGSVVAASSRD